MISDNKQLRVYDELGKFVRSSVEEIISKELNDWYGWHCSAGTRYLYIDYDKNVFICNRACSAATEVEWASNWDEFLENQKKIINKWDLNQQELDIIKSKWRDFLKTSSVGYLGKIDEEIVFPFAWFTCQFNMCSCGADVIISKCKDRTYKGLLAVTENGYEGQFVTKYDQVDNFKDINQVAVEMDFPIPYQILWDLTRRCNYNCSYCWPYAHNKIDKFIPTEDIIDACEKFILEWAGGKEIRFNFGGGEPTLHPGFLDILKYLKQNRQFVLVTSNGSRSPNFWEEAVRYINSINLSAHFEFVDKKRFLENLTVILDWHDFYDDDHWVEVKLMAPPGKVHEAMEFGNQIKEMDRINKLGANERTKGVCILVPIRDLDNSATLVDYSEEELECFQNQ